MILVVGQGIWNASSELLDRMPPDEIVEQVRELATSFPGVSGVERLIGRKTGLQYILDSHLVVPGTMTVKEAHELGHQVKDRLMAEMSSINDIVVHVEPESDASGSDTSGTLSCSHRRSLPLFDIGNPGVILGPESDSSCEF